MKNLEEILTHYLVAALWSSLDERDNDQEYLDEEFSIHEFSRDAREQSMGDVEQFVVEAGDLLDGISEEMIGHDIWLTRNGHGAGFWDRGYGEIGDKLSDIARKMGEVNLYAENGQVHID